MKGCRDARSWPWMQNLLLCDSLTPVRTAGQLQQNIGEASSWHSRARPWLLKLSAENCPGKSSSSPLVCTGLSASCDSCFRCTTTVLVQGHLCGGWGGGAHFLFAFHIDWIQCLFNNTMLVGNPEPLEVSIDGSSSDTGILRALLSLCIDPL